MLISEKTTGSIKIPVKKFDAIVVKYAENACGPMDLKDLFLAL